MPDAPTCATCPATADLTKHHLAMKGARMPRPWIWLCHPCHVELHREEHRRQPGAVTGAVREHVARTMPLPNHLIRPGFRRSGYNQHDRSSSHDD